MATWGAGLLQVPGCLGPRRGKYAGCCRRLLSAWRPSHWHTLGHLGSRSLVQVLLVAGEDSQDVSFAQPSLWQHLSDSYSQHFCHFSPHSGLRDGGQVRLQGQGRQLCGLRAAGRRHLGTPSMASCGLETCGLGGGRAVLWAQWL